VGVEEDRRHTESLKTLPTSCGPDAARESAALRESESDALTQHRKRTRIPRFCERAIGRTRISPVEVTTDRYRVYPRVLDELLPAAFHSTEVHANNAIETDHGRLKARLRPMRGLKRDRTARVIVAGHAFIQNLRRGFYDLGTDVPSVSRLADAFAGLALIM